MQLTDFEMIERADFAGHFQCVLGFGDEYELSIISGKGACGSTDAPYEISVIKNGGFAELPGITEIGDVIKTHLTESEVDVIITKMQAITNKEPVQI